VIDLEEVSGEDATGHIRASPRVCQMRLSSLIIWQNKKS
jgi:hypothetical protein